MYAFVIECKNCGSKEVAIKATAVMQGQRIKCKLYCPECGAVEELPRDAVTMSFKDYCYLGFRANGVHRRKTNEQMPKK